MLIFLIGIINNIMFKRKIYDKLLKWKKESNGNSILLIEGAKGVGKTTVVEEFAKNEFPRYLIIDFSKASKKIIKAFNYLNNIDKFYKHLFLSLAINPLPKGSLLIFDEVQYCYKVKEILKSLVKDKRYYYIEISSSSSFNLDDEDDNKNNIEEVINMNPMDYEEFLWAINNEYEIDIIKEYFLNKKIFDSNLHNQLLKNYRLYLAVGGMPKVVDTYIKTHDFNLIDKEKRKIIKLYEKELKNIDKIFKTFTLLIYKQIPLMLNKNSTRFIVSSINKRADSLLFIKTMEKLIESKIVSIVYKVNNPNEEFTISKDSSSFKIYYNDVGLLTSVIYAKSSNKSLDVYQRLILDNLQFNFKMLYENAACQTLVSNGFKSYYYSWEDKKDNKKKNYEIDFIIFKEGKIIPIEVKSHNISNKTSLEEFNKKFNEKIDEKYIVSSFNLKVMDKLINIPYYVFFALN